MFAAPLSWMPDSELDWSNNMPPTDRRCTTCGDVTATKRGKYCAAHSKSKLAEKKATLEEMEQRSAPPVSTIVSLGNEIRELEQDAEPVADREEVFYPRTGEWG